MRVEADERDAFLIKKHYDALNGKAGALVVKMWLERENGIIMNHKKIRRLMPKYKLVATIRQANPSIARWQKSYKSTKRVQTYSSASLT